MKPPKAIDLPDPTFFFRPDWSPDGKHIAYTDTDYNLWYVNLESGKTKKVDTERYAHPNRSMNPEWSPDGKWIAYARLLDNHLKVIKAHNVETGETLQLTDGMSDAIAPVWDESGKYLYFLASTDFGLNTAWLDMTSYEHPITRGLYAIVLAKGVPSPMLPKSDEEKLKPDEKADDKTGPNVGDKKDDKKKKKDEPAFNRTKEVKIDKEDIDQRIVSLGVPLKNYVELLPGPEGTVFYLENAEGEPAQKLHKFTFEDQKSKEFLAEMQEATVSHDRKQLLYNVKGAWSIVPTAGEKAKAGEGKVNLHSNVDRRARILPWGAAAEIPKISPVMATAAYLKHIRLAWNSAWGQDESLHLENQFVVVTVPASFDEVARELTLESAKTAGIGTVVLLEEPLAAFYSWLMHHENNWRKYVQPGELILVCDVGGGTTDFTLIVLRDVEGSPRFERIAVGDHLVLGGDNIDLALARQVEAQLTGTRRSMSTDRWKALCHQCRQAKEALLGGTAENFKVTMMGEGSRLIAGTQRVNLDKAVIAKLVLEGFFPTDTEDVRQPAFERKGITEFGLPYEQEPAITRHMKWFLDRHRNDVSKILQRSSAAPDLILYNGGSLKPAEIQARIRMALQNWTASQDSVHPKVLENPDLDLAVAFGAAYYGLVKIGAGVRVGSGSPRAYYLGVARHDRGQPKPHDREVMCIVERGLDEGSTIPLEDKAFDVLTNQPVSFDIFSSSYRSGDRSGDLVRVDDSFTPLPPLQTVVQYGKKGAQKAIPVKIEAEYTEVGTLALWCRSRISEHRWKLQFQLRDTATPEAADDAQILELAVVETARDLLNRVMSGDDKSRVEKLAKKLSSRVDLPRDDWPLGFIRSLADDLLDLTPVRNKGPILKALG